MELKKKLPPDRTLKQIQNHYLVEKSIADRLKMSSHCEERKQIFSTMYEELFSKVPDHPRLVRRTSERLTSLTNKNKFSLVNGVLDKTKIFAEFASGDCRFAYEVAEYVNYIYGIDISDQRESKNCSPENFQLIIYDGYNINGIKDNSIDIVFSDQLIEHFHPEDTRLHFKLVHRILKKNGKYIFRTPHLLSGPYDVSRYFSDEPECFHLKEWTYIEIRALLKDLKYSDFCPYWHASGMSLKLPYSYFALSEQILKLFPKKYIRKFAKYLIPTLFGVAVK